MSTKVSSRFTPSPSRTPDLGQYTSDEHTLIVVEGVVEHGDERGRQLGFPTANVTGIDAVRLDGVYGGTVQVSPETYGPMFVAAVSVGHRPTYYGRDGVRLLEAHLLGFTGDLYDKQVRIELHVRLRPQHKYVDSPTLVQQLHLDVQATRAWARANGLGSLLAVDRPNDARWARGRRTSSDPLSRARIRDLRRRELIQQAVREVDPSDLTHEAIAERTGIPVGYLAWRFPTVDDLLAVR